MRNRTRMDDSSSECLHGRRVTWPSSSTGGDHKGRWHGRRQYMPHGVLFPRCQRRRDPAEDARRTARPLRGGDRPADQPVLRRWHPGVRSSPTARSRPSGRAACSSARCLKHFEPGRNRNTLRETDIERIVTAFREYHDVERFAARVATLDEIAGNDWNLNISRYVKRANPRSGSTWPTRSPD